MAKKKISLDQFAVILERMPEDMEKRVINGLRKAGARLVVLVEHSIRTNKPYALVDRGRLVQSVMLIPTPTGAIVRVDAPYAAPLEYGARPFMPPWQPIFDWAKRKGFDDPGGVTRAVRWKFFHEGFKPKRFFAKARARWSASNTLSKAVMKALAQKKGV